MKKLHPWIIHPGTILDQEFMKPKGLSYYSLAKKTGVQGPVWSEIKNGKRSITPRTAIRLSVVFGNTAESWMALQATYDLMKERQRLQEIRHKKKIYP